MLAAALTLGPHPLQAVVVVPARNEEEHIESCLRSLAAQEGVDPAAYRVVVVLHRCDDATASIVERIASAAAHPQVQAVECADGGVGRARRLGMDLAAELLGAGSTAGLIATTDADTVVAPDWLAVQLALVATGAEAIGGLIELGDGDAAASAVEVRRQRLDDRMAAAVTASASGGGPTPEHPFFSGASIGLTAGAYRRSGGLPPIDALEDEALAGALVAAGVPITRSASVRVRTSARRVGRAPRGLAVDLAVSSWRAQRSFDGVAFADLERLVAAKTSSVSVVLPAREEAATIGAVVAAVRTLAEIGLVDEVVVIDAGSADGTARLAAEAGATVHQEGDLMPAWGPCLGKGDAMWRSLSVVGGDIVCFLDADTANFSRTFAAATVAPLLVDPSLMVAKGRFERPLRVGEVALPREGGRVTELAARPALNLWFPELAGFDQPLAGEVAIRRELAVQLPMPVGYGVEIGMLIDSWRRCGLDALCQVDLGTRQNRHQPLRELSAMAYAVLATAARRSVTAPSGAGAGAGTGTMLMPAMDPGGPGEVRAVPLDERPPYASLGPDGLPGAQ